MLTTETGKWTHTVTEHPLYNWHIIIYTFARLHLICTSIIIIIIINSFIYRQRPNSCQSYLKLETSLPENRRSWVMTVSGRWPWPTTTQWRHGVKTGGHTSWVTSLTKPEALSRMTLWMFLENWSSQEYRWVKTYKICTEICAFQALFFSNIWWNIWACQRD